MIQNSIEIINASNENSVNTNDPDYVKDVGKGGNGGNGCDGMVVIIIDGEKKIYKQDGEFSLI